MVSGGARPTGGRPLDPNALRRDRPNDPEWTTLPSRREGPVPPWPLKYPTTREKELWAIYWKKPQAVLWERNDQVYEVAIHVRQLTVAEERNAPTASRTLLRQQMEGLLMTLPAMRMARIRVAGDDLADQRTVPTPVRESSRDRMKVVNGGDD